MDTSKEIASDTVASDTLAEKPKPDPQVQDSKSIKEEASHTVSSGNGIPNVIASSPNSLVQKKNICLSKLINVSSKSNPERTNDNELKNVQHSDLRALVMPVTPGKASEDGYNWRKYGQKNVKSSEFVRSYYKCTHPTCQVKKQVERTRYGQIMDTVYLGGKHDHPKAQSISVADAQPISVAVASVESMDRIYLGKHDHPKAQSISVTEAQPVSVAVPSAASAQEETMGEPTTPGGECKSCSAQVRTSHISESSENPKPPAVMEGVIVSRNAELKSDSIVGKVCNAENSEPKRRKLECCIADASWADKQSTESCLSGGLYEVDKADKQISDSPVVVRTTSNADIVNDGYRWRKYGQKLVKGNPNPRSYYRCSNVGCPVKKHVERACHDPKVVITTYEGRHDHNVPATRTITTNMNPISSSPRVGSIESDIVGHEVIVRYSLHSESGRPNEHCLPDAEPVHS